jgi:antitoxin component YwqK of YwqJK toxin-antitoxin module
MSECESVSNPVSEPQFEEQFYPDGTLLARWRREDGQLCGMSCTYYSSGALLDEFAYEKGRLQGMRRHFLETGELDYEVEYRGHSMNGIGRRYFASGELMAEGIVRKDKWQSVKFFYKSGAVQETQTYDDGRQDGPTEVFYEDGTLQADMELHCNELHGISREYFPDGSLETRETYEHGQLVNRKKYGKDRQLLLKIGDFGV